MSLFTHTDMTHDIFSSYLAHPRPLVSFEGGAVINSTAPKVKRKRDQVTRSLCEQGQIRKKKRSILNLNPTEKRLRRRKQNREAAQKSRERKKQTIVTLEAKINKLEQQNQGLQDIVSQQSAQIKQLLNRLDQNVVAAPVARTQATEVQEPSDQNSANNGKQTNLIHESAALVSLQLEELVRFLMFVAIMTYMLPNLLMPSVLLSAKVSIQQQRQQQQQQQQQAAKMESKRTTLSPEQPVYQEEDSMDLVDSRSADFHPTQVWYTPRPTPGSQTFSRNFQTQKVLNCARKRKIYDTQGHVGRQHAVPQQPPSKKRMYISQKMLTRCLTSPATRQTFYAWIRKYGHNLKYSHIPGRPHTAPQVLCLEYSTA